MTQITTPPSPYKIIVPKTVLSGGVQNLSVNLAGFTPKHLQVRFGVQSTSAVTGGTQCSFVPRTSNIADANYHYTGYVGVGVPVVTLTDNVGNNQLPLNGIPGTDAVATELAVFIMDMIDCQSSQLKHVFGKGSFYPTAAIKRTTWDIYGEFNNAAVFDGFQLNNLGGNFSTNSWYEVIQLD